MAFRAIVTLGSLCLLAACGDGEGAKDTSTPRESTLSSTAAPVPAPPPPATRQSSLVSIAQLRSELGAQDTSRGLVVVLPNDVLFDFDKADLRVASTETLDKLATLARSEPGPIMVEGHSDSKGDDAYNLTLSKRRADAVAAALASRGVDGARIKATGLGEAKPVAPNASAEGADNPEGRQKNRRVEVILPNLAS